ncbi:MAG: anti-sigma F factor [Clostridia bacterium]|nr:anti-sigma F factor [Clostridia bacterium]
MKAINTMKMEIESRSVNESFSRVAVASFIAQLDPTIEELGDIKTAVSEAVTNSIVHGYKEGKGKIYITVSIFENAKVSIRIRDKGCGIENIKQAMEPLFTTMGGERAGLGFAVMESFMDKVKVRSVVGKGTQVTLEKKINGRFLNDGN